MTSCEVLSFRNVLESCCYFVHPTCVYFFLPKTDVFAFWHNITNSVDNTPVNHILPYRISFEMELRWSETLSSALRLPLSRPVWFWGRAFRLSLNLDHSRIHLNKENTKLHPREENIQCLIRSVTRNAGENRSLFLPPPHKHLHLYLSITVYYYRLVSCLVDYYRF